ncbi:helix-turn-helix transcriptional regulator [Bacillus sp. AFS077874]|uniref:helix-turn-helix domain-containing protein n=1 Tax=Bacillus sp. AFS077874 TaxID=2033513 RepID=UPI001596D5B3|nr:helix-turn-helix transcriptional regulator [Bacillus sp. AFS077874]
MEVTINLPDDVYSDLENLVGYYRHNNLLNNEEDTTSIEEVISGAIAMFLAWLPLRKERILSTKTMIIENRIQSIFEQQGKTQKDVTELTGISKSAISNIWNGGVPTLENFLRIWISLGKPPIELMLEIKPDLSE